LVEYKPESHDFSKWLQSLQGFRTRDRSQLLYGGTALEHPRCFGKTRGLSHYYSDDFLRYS
jgi:hypothetical protein